MWNVVTVSLRQRIVPDALLGRVNASYRLLAWGSQPFGALLGGLAAQALGLRAVFVIAATMVLALLLASRILTEDALQAAENASDGAPSSSPTSVARAGDGAPPA
jgi:hypothetical protein